MKNMMVSFSVIVLVACSAKQVSPGAENVFVSDQPPPVGCMYVGEVQGSQGNFWTAQFTADRKLLSGARNEMRNQALSLGANYVSIETQSHSHNTGRYSLGGTHSSVIFGNAYACPPKALGKV